MINKDFAERIDLEKICLRTKRIIPRRNFRLDTYPERLEKEAEQMVIELEASIAGLRDAHIKIDEIWPETWWDAVKDRWAPKWFKKRWPVNYKSVHIDQPIYGAVCPHLSVEPERTHLDYMLYAARNPDFGDVDYIVLDAMDDIKQEFPLPPHMEDKIYNALWKTAVAASKMERMTG